MNALAEFRRVFNSPFFNNELDFFKKMNQDLVPQMKDYSVFRLNEEGTWYIEVPMPGLTEKDIKVNVDLEKRQLSLTGSKSSEIEENDEKVSYIKRSNSNYQYSFYMDEKFDLESIRAQCENGMLKIELKEHRIEEDKDKKLLEIQVQGAKV